MSEWKVGDELVDWDGDRLVVIEVLDGGCFVARYRSGSLADKTMEYWPDGGFRRWVPPQGLGTSIATASAEQLDRLAALVGIERRAGEAVEDLRKRRIGVVTGVDAEGFVQVLLGVDPSPAPSVSVEVHTKREGEPWVNEFEGAPVSIDVDVHPLYGSRRPVNTTPPTRDEALHALADTLGVSPRYVTDEMVDAAVERRSARLEEWAGARQNALHNKLARDGAAKADDAGYLFNRYGSRDGVTHLPYCEPGASRAYTMNVPPGIQAEFRLLPVPGDSADVGWGWDAADEQGTAATLREACDAVDEAIRDAMAEKPQREPWPMRWIGTGDLGGPGTRGHR